MMKSFVALAAMAAVLPAAALPSIAHAQAARPMLEYATAAKIRDACIAWAASKNAKVAVAIYDDSGKLIAFANMDGTLIGSNQLAQDKGKSAASFRMTTAMMADVVKTYVPGIVAAGGGQPFYTSAGVPLGGVGVSGGTVEEDIACGRAGIEAAGLKPAG